MILISTASTSLTMSRVTRHQQFSASLDDFMVSMNDLYYPDMKQWFTECQTKNKSSSVHEYCLRIQKQNDLYVIDPYFNVLTGEFMEREVVKEDQEVPTVDEFHTHFHEYFDKYILTRSDTVLSGLSIVDSGIGENGDLNVNIRVKYYRSHLPYPTSLQSPKQLKERCVQLQLTNCELESELQASTEVVMEQSKEIRRLKRRMNNMLVSATLKLRETIHKMQKKIRESYEELNKAEECPVCYECIKSEELMVPACCHNICSGCYDRCEDCPICRELYY